jgi:hypothetical protein
MITTTVQVTEMGARRMPNFDKRTAEDDLEIATRIMKTVERQMSTYRVALEKVRLLRKEFVVDESMRKAVMSTPESMSELLIERGIPEVLAYGMAAEDFQDKAFAPGRGLGFWTWSCCCTSCCITDCSCTIVTVKTGAI